MLEYYYPLLFVTAMLTIGILVILGSVNFKD